MAKTVGLSNTIKNYFKRSVEIIRFPKPFLKDLKAENSIKISIRFLAFLCIVNAVLLFIFSLILVMINSAQVDWGIAIPGALLYIFITAVSGFIITLILGVVIHLYVKLFRGKAKLAKTVQLFIYSNTPVLLLGWIPIVGSLASLYSLYILYLGGMEIHGFSKRISLIAFVIIPVIAIIGSTLMQVPQ